MTVVVEPYDPRWPGVFAGLLARLEPVLGDVATAIEHVGSTAVPGLSAKPVIDVDVIVDDGAGVAVAIERLAAVGYEHLGDLGIAGREAFRRPAGTPAHNLYVCVTGAESLRNHLAVRDRLRADPDAAAAYGALKVALASEGLAIDDYVARKTPFLLGLLASAGFSSDELGRIEAANHPRR